MLDIKKTAQDLDNLLYNSVVKSGIIVPVNKTTFKFKNYLIVRDRSNGWSVFLLGQTKQHVASTFLKVAAFAICKAHDRRRYTIVNKIKIDDAEFERNYIDSLFFQNTYKVSSDWAVKDTALWRYEIVHEKAVQAKQRIDKMFYSSIV